MSPEITPGDAPLSPRDQADLAAFADGRLDPRRRAVMAARVARDARLQAAVAEQRRAIAAVRGAEVTVPAELRARVHRTALETAPRRRRQVIAVWSAADLAAVVLALVLVLSLPGEVAPGPTMVQAADLATRPSMRPPPGRDPGRPALLDRSVAGVAFPDLERRFGWRATGARTDRLGENRVETVFYERGDRRIGYSIVAGPRLPPPVATTDQVIDSVRLRLFLAEDRPVVAFVRRGRTCLLSGRRMARRELFALAGWRGGGQVRF